MSTIVMSLCWRLQMPPTAKSVFMSLADNSNDHGYCWPSIPKICERTCFGRSAVINAVRWLENHKYLAVDRSNGRKTKYWITVPGIQDGKPVLQTNRSSKQAGANGGQYPSARQTKPVREADSNRKEPSLSVTTTTEPQGLVFPGVPMRDLGQVVVVVMKKITEARADGLPHEICQDLLDELTGVMADSQAKSIRDPVSYLRGLISRALTDDFVMSRGLSIKQARISRARDQELARTRAIREKEDQLRRETPEARARSDAARKKAIADLVALGQLSNAGDAHQPPGHS